MRKFPQSLSQGFNKSNSSISQLFLQNQRVATATLFTDSSSSSSSSNIANREIDESETGRPRDEESQLAQGHMQLLLNYEPRTVVDIVHNREREIVKEFLDAQKLHDRLADVAIRIAVDPSKQRVEGEEALEEVEEKEGILSQTIMYEHEDSQKCLNYKNLQKLYQRRELSETRPIHGILPPAGHALYQQSVIEQKVARMNEPYLPYKKEDIPEYEAAELMGTIWSQPDASEEAKTFGDRFTENDIAEALELYADHVLRKKVLNPHKSLKYTKMLQVFSNQILNNRMLIEQYDEAFLKTVETHGEDITAVQKELKNKFSEIYVRSMLAMGAVPTNVSNEAVLKMEEDRLARTRARNRDLLALSANCSNEEYKEKVLREKKIARYLESMIGQKRKVPSPMSVLVDALSAKAESAEDVTPEEAEAFAEVKSAEASTEIKPDLDQLIADLERRKAEYADLFVQKVNIDSAEDTTASQKRESYQELYKNKHAFDEDLNKLERVGRFVDDILYLKSINDQLENMIVQLVPMMYQSRVLVHDLVTCNKLLYICKTTEASDLTRVDFGSTLDKHDTHTARNTLMNKAISIAEQSEREYSVIHKPFEVSKEPFYASSGYIPQTRLSVRGKQRQVRKY